MEYKKDNINGYNLHMIKTSKFNSVLMAINIKVPLKKEEITYNSLLINYLMLATDKYKTSRDLDVIKEELYSLSSWSNQKLYFNMYINKIGNQFLNEKYTEKGYLEKSIIFALSYLFSPLIDGNSFDDKVFKQAKNILKININSHKEKTMRYALERLYEEMGKDRGFGYSSLGYSKDLDKITAQDLYNYYQNLLKQMMVDIFMIGLIDFDDTKKVIAKALNFKGSRKDEKIKFVNNLKQKKTVTIIKESKDIDQSILGLGFIIEPLTEFEKQYVSYVYNYILGDGADSLLFKEVREKNSLCYSINSDISNSFNVMTIIAGINKSSYDQALDIIKKQVNRIDLGDFNYNLINQAKRSYINICKASQDSDVAIINDYQNKEYFNYDLVDKQMKRIKLVKKEDVINLSHKIHLDTIFFLEGSNKNE